MAHVRKQIRDAVVTALTGLTTTGSNVFATRVYPLASAKLPGLCIYTAAEDAELEIMGSNRTLMRSLDVIVEAYAQGTTTVDNSLDQIALEIEEALAADSGVDALVKDIYLTRTDIDLDGGESEKVIGAARLTFRAVYRTAENDVETAI
jgi:hypothetical protein